MGKGDGMTDVRGIVGAAVSVVGETDGMSEFAHSRTVWDVAIVTRQNEHKHRRVIVWCFDSSSHAHSIFTLLVSPLAQIFPGSFGCSIVQDTSDG